MGSHPSLTKIWHTDTYAAIDPKRPELSVKGKKIVITGGGSGVGRGFCESFATGGAASIAILGRREAVLQQAKKELIAKYEGLEVTTHVTDVADAVSVEKAAKEVGDYDILVANAGVLPEIGSLVDVDSNDWWQGFEVNVKGSFNTARAFLPNKRPHATLLAINAGSIQMPVDKVGGLSGYNVSKFAALKLFEYFAAENPDVQVVSMHPGVVDTDMSSRFMGGSSGRCPDKVALPSDFAVWLCSEEAKFLRGKFVWCNWDVEELKAKQQQIEGSLLLTGNCIGWPYES